MSRVSYASGAVPADYRCAECGAHGVKLWREYNGIRVLCVVCLCAEAGVGDAFDAAGFRPDDLVGRTDTLDWHVPAVPDEEGVGYWGYTSVPDAGVSWWRALPTRAGGGEA